MFKKNAVEVECVCVCERKNESCDFIGAALRAAVVAAQLNL